MEPVIKNVFVQFVGEMYNYEEFKDGSIRIFKERNSRGFKINIKVSGDEKEQEEGMQALKDFFVKGNL